MYDLLQLSYDVNVYHFWFVFFSYLGCFSHSRVTEACSGTTDLIVRVNVSTTTTSLNEDLGGGVVSQENDVSCFSSFFSWFFLVVPYPKKTVFRVLISFFFPFFFCFFPFIIFYIPSKRCFVF